MKKLIMALALTASIVAIGSTDTYKFSSKMHAYSLAKQKYVSTSLNGTLVVDTDSGEMHIDAVKKDTKENIHLDLDVETQTEVVSTSLVPVEVTNDDGSVSTNMQEVVSTNMVGNAFDEYAIVSGKKNKVGAAILKFTSDDDNIVLYLAGNGATKIKTLGCGPCGDTTTCVKIKSFKGAYVGSYECGCSNGQHYGYDFTCELPDEKDVTKSPVWGTWSAKLKSTID